MFRIEANNNFNKSNLWSLNDSGNLEFSYKDEILAQYQNLFRTIFGDINIDESTPQGQIITSLTQVDLSTISYLENLANAFFLGGSGEFLDKWAWNLYRVVRKQGTPSSAIITITGRPETEIPADFTISDGSQNYIIESPTQIPESGEIKAKFINLEINDKTKEILFKYIKQTNDKELKELLTQYSKGSRCTFPDFKCNAPCGFSDGVKGEREI